ncbi:hypothetical protein C0995_005707 [Termitomyces sp. Mi166|nr:hypothetical protein C0995_005707 [Termitomyces sp. Mi166\
MPPENTENNQLKDEIHVVDAASIPPESYEDAAVTAGAPVEKVSPLGYHVDSVAVIFLNIGRMIGTGVFSTPSLAVYLEYASYFPHRSGAEVAYLEKARNLPFDLEQVPAHAHIHERPILSLILAQYLLVAAGAETSTWNVRGLAIGAMTVIVLTCILSTKWSLRLCNALGIVKVITLIFIAITGLVVLGGHTRVEDPHANFRSAFVGTTSNGNSLATALVKVNFAYAGFEDPIRTMKRCAPLSLTVVFILYFFVNIAYFAAVPKEQIRTSKQLTASLFFIAVFGNSRSVKALSALVAISSFGNILSTIIGSSRIIREIGRQGVLPYPKFWASTKPFNTPLGPYLLKWLLTVIVILAPPAGDAFNFSCLFFVRRRRAKIGAPKTEFRVWNVVLIFAICVNIYLLALPWVPPEGGIYGGDVSFFYATYCLTGIAICEYDSLVISGLAYLLYIHILPKFGGYAIRQLVEELDDGATTNKLVRVPDAELEKWDATHDQHGGVIERRIQSFSR